MNKFSLMLEAALGNYKKTAFKGRPAIELWQDDTAQYLLVVGGKSARIEDLEPGTKVAIDQHGFLRPAVVTSKPFRHVMKQTGVTQVSPGGRGPSPEYQAHKRHAGAAEVTVKFLDDQQERYVAKRKMGAKIPILTKVSKHGAGIPGRPQATPTAPPPRKRRRGKRGGRKHRPQQAPPQ